MQHRAAKLFLLVVVGGVGCHSRSAANGPDMTAPSCPPPSDPVPAYNSDGSGFIVGADVTATLCHVGVHAFVSPYTTPPGRALLMLGGVSHSPPQIPAGSTGGSVVGSLFIDAPSPGVYSSASDQACGGLDYAFQLPAPPGTDCDGGTPPACPANCASICSSRGCAPCMLNPPSVGYQAAVASDCLGGTQSAVGSWEISLTSATPESGPAPGYYLVHGTLTANVSSGSGAAMLSLAF